MQTIWQDVRYALRMLGKNPGFTATCVFNLALGVGATTAIFSVVYGVLLRPLPYHKPEQIVRLWEQSHEGHRMNFADANFTDVRTQNHSLMGVAEYTVGEQAVTVGSESSRTQVASVSHDFFQVMDVQPIAGREFSPDEQHPAAAPVAMVSHAYWKQALGSTQDFSSIRLKVSGQAASIIGVLPAGFRFPANADIWLPRELTEPMPSRTAHNWNVVARLRDSASLDQARAELSGIAQRLKQQYGEDTAMVGVAVEPLREAMTTDVRPALLILLGASAFLLLIACANVVNLMLAQAAAREKELCVRAALGAQRLRLIRQFVTESFLLSSLGGGLGILLAYWGVSALPALAPENLPRLSDVAINIPVLSFSLVTVMVVSISLGIFTAVRSVSSAERNTLNDGSRGGTGSFRKQRLGRVIAAGQLATALVLLIGAGLLGRSLLRVLSVNSGFRTQGIATMDIGMPDALKKADRVNFLNKLLTQLRQIPEVNEVGGTNALPLTDLAPSDGYYVPMNPGQISPRMQDVIRRTAAGELDKDPELLADFSQIFDELFRDKSRLGDADFVIASNGFFKALGVPLLQGRLFDDRDTIEATHVALVSQSLAREKWPNEDAIGRTIEFGNMDGDPRLLTIVGVVGDVREHTLEVAPRPTVYVDYRQRPNAAWHFTIVMQTSGKPENVFAPARAILQDLNADIPPQFQTLSQVYAASFDARRFSLTLVTIFSGVALLLAVAGIYGVISYSVAQRTREIGVRMALGASTGEVLGMVIKQGAITGTIGIFVGILGALALTRWLQSQLFEVSPSDPTTFLGLAFLLLLTSLAACWIPGRRAGRVDPMVALRYE
jgi:putative ABC transport system permease protein